MAGGYSQHWMCEKSFGLYYCSDCTILQVCLCPLNSVFHSFLKEPGDTKCKTVTREWFEERFSSVFTAVAEVSLTPSFSHMYASLLQHAVLHGKQLRT